MSADDGRVTTPREDAAMTTEWYRPCLKCGLYPGHDQHVARADHPFEGDLPAHVPSGPWPCAPDCAALVAGPCPTPNRHAYRIKR